MSTYTGQHFAPADPIISRSGSRRSKGAIAAGLATLVLAAAAGFFVGRQTAPDDNKTAATANEASPADALVTQGLALHQAGKLDEATSLYQQALKADSKNKFAHFNLGQIAQTRQQWDASIDSYRAALATDPKFSAALYNLGLAYASKGDRANAISTLRKALEVTPNNAPTLFNLGTLLVQDGKNDEGTKLIAQALTLDPTLKPAT